MQERQTLLDVAEQSILAGLNEGHPVEVQPEDFPARLREPAATFVTLHRGSKLQGCIGTVEGVRPLVSDVAHNAFQAAFFDPRFEPLQADDFPLLDIEISRLSQLQPFDFRNERELLSQIRPGVDGLVLEYGPYRGLLLPDVWRQIPDRTTFLAHLKLKAGIPPSFWSDRIVMKRFTTERFARRTSDRDRRPRAA